MAIQGYTDNASIQHRALPVPVLAMVKKGDVKPERGAGRNLSYFRFAWEDKRAEAIFNAAFGNEPLREIPITVLSDEVDAVLDSAYRKYLGNNTLDKKCDGHEILFSLNPEFTGHACTCDPAKRDSVDVNIAKAFCQPKAYFHFTIPELCRDLGYLGKFILLTGSLYEMRDMATILNSVKQGTGKLIGQPFLLRRSEKHYDVMLNGKPSRLTQYNVELIPPIQLVLSRIENPLIAAPDLPQLESGEYFEDEIDANAPATSHFEAPKRDINDVDGIIGTTPPTLTDEQAFIFNLMQIILPMCKHENHARNAIEKAIEDSAIGKGDSLDKAAGVMLLRRMKSQWGLTEDESRGILPEALGMTMKEYLTANPRDYAGIWATLTARYAEMPE